MTASRGTISAVLFSANAVPAPAQEAVAPAVGTSIGREAIGLSNNSNVRGFSPTAAGNIRIDDIYFDQVWGLNSRLRRTTNIRVGRSALGIPFSAPTGIVDYGFRKPGDTAALSGLVSGNQWVSVALEVDAVLPVSAGKMSVRLGGAIDTTHVVMQRLHQLECQWQFVGADPEQLRYLLRHDSHRMGLGISSIGRRAPTLNRKHRFDVGSLGQAAGQRPRRQYGHQCNVTGRDKGCAGFSAAYGLGSAVLRASGGGNCDDGTS